MESSMKKPKHLRPMRHQQLDLFLCELFDASIKNDRDSMGHPLFALSTGDMRKRTYESDSKTITVIPSAYGMATIFDKDVWIYSISQLIKAKNAGKSIERTIRFTAHDYLQTTNRGTGGRSYALMADSLERLAGSRLKLTGKGTTRREQAGFGMIESYKIAEKDDAGRLVAIEVTLSDWLYKSILGDDVLTLSSDYFRIRKALDRRVYEIARKHCGRQPSWKVSLKVMYEKSGSRSPIRNFRVAIKSLAESDELPDYSVKFDVKADMISFTRRNLIESV